MQETGVVLGVLRERGRKGLPCTQLYRQMFNRVLYLTAYGNIYSNQGAMTPGANEETADGMSEEKIEQIIGLMRNERYRFSPARRIYIPKKNGRLRPLGLPSWSDKLVGEVCIQPSFDLRLQPRARRLDEHCRPAGRVALTTWAGFGVVPSCPIRLSLPVRPAMLRYCAPRTAGCGSRWSGCGC